MSGTLQLKNLNIGALSPSIYYAATGIVFLILLPNANYPPHIGFTAIMSLITAYGLYTKRRWAKWLVGALFFVATAISTYTVYFLLLTNVLVSVVMLIYAVLTWYFTYYVIIKKI